ncbi:MAG: ferrous iron transport protein B [Propionibacteriaceae bacterium]|jgi:ferrous iron transport protein B|nr:ferrous iron transport protein B [Propionibacteriaceae bacterium]
MGKNSTVNVTVKASQVAEPAACCEAHDEAGCLLGSTAPRRGNSPLEILTTKPCCLVHDETAASGRTIALVGAPNVGKSTLFNALTGARAVMGNWPGTTVEVFRGVWRYRVDATTCDCVECDCGGDHESGKGASRREATIIDMPGAYALESSSPDEDLTREFVDDPTAAPDLLVAVIDAAHLARSLYLVAELREKSRRMVVALTMSDMARRHGIEVDTYALSEVIGVPVVQVDPRHRSGLDNLTRVILDAIYGPIPQPRARVADIADDEDERFAWISTAVDRGTVSKGVGHQQFSDKVDRVLLAPVLGPLIFLAVMWLVFQITTTVAAPLQDGLSWIFDEPVSEAVTWALTQVGLDGSWVEGLLVTGVIGGLGALLSFTPLMALMFVLLALLEDSGYLARAAVLTDRAMSVLGLPGRAFLPLVVGFGCNVPAIAATRVLSTPRQRLLTVLLIPFTACTARLTVFVMLGTVFFDRWAGTAVFAMYLLSIILVVLTGLVLRRTLWRTMGKEPLVIDLPPYQTPTLRLTVSVAWGRLKGFLQTAAGIILGTIIVVWLLQSIPVIGGVGFAQVDIEDSVYGWFAQAVSPLFSLAGFGTWQTVSALIVGFVAKEAVISSWAQTYAVIDPDDVATLGQHITSAFDLSSGGHIIPAAVAFMVFFLAYTPCVATLAAQKREVGWKWTGFGVVMQLIVALVLAIAVFQVGRLFW